MMRLTLLALTLFVAATGFAEEAIVAAVPTAQPTATYVMCKNKNFVRTMRVVKKDGGGCKTSYTKEGIDQIVSESSWTKGCEKVLNNIRINLEKASWKCKDISDSRVSFSND